MISIKERVLSTMQEPGYTPQSLEGLIKPFISNNFDKQEMIAIIHELEEEGKIYRTKKNKYGLPKQMNLYVGRLQVHPKGFGFLVQEEDTEDIFISADAMNGAMHGDKVIARHRKSIRTNSNKEGEIIRIIDRAVKEVIGVYEKGKKFGFVIPENRRITQDVYIPGKKAKDAKTGDVVLCVITEYPIKGRNPEGKITRIIGKQGQDRVALETIVLQNQLPLTFPEKVLAAAEEVHETIHNDEIKGRLDLRDQLIFTIDGSDAKDLDDAISIEKKSDGTFQLGVHIADVSHYVRENKTIDKEARKRATSVYLVDTVLPMLPAALSNGICSLHPAVDRLTLSCIMQINEKGKVTDHFLAKSVINSSYRLNYEDVSDFLEGKSSPVEDKIELTEKLQLGKELASILREKRKNRGAIDFDFPESKIEMKDHQVVDVHIYPRRVANRMIEEFMLIANETVAEQMFWQKEPFVYRVHEQPSGEKIQDFKKFIASFGYQLKGDADNIHPKEMQKLSDQIKGTIEEPIISRLMLRSFKQARYTPENLGHFGLAAKYYCHFTSPIRRYPDLQIHRIISESMRKPLDQKRRQHYQAITADVSMHASLMERKAEEAERQVQDYRKAQFMEAHIGETFEGVVSGITSFGIFVSLHNTIEGLVRLSSMDDDFYEFDEDTYQLKGQGNHKVFKMGDTVQVKVVGVDVAVREINFELVQEESTDEE